MGNSDSSFSQGITDFGKGIAKGATSAIGAIGDQVLNPIVQEASFGLIPQANVGGSLANWANSQYKKGALIVRKAGDGYRVSHPSIGKNVPVLKGSKHHAMISKMVQEKKGKKNKSIK